MDNVLIKAGMDVPPEYEKVLKDLLAQLDGLRNEYKDTTGTPVKFRPRRLYN